MNWNYKRSPRSYSWVCLRLKSQELVTHSKDKSKESSRIPTEATYRDGGHKKSSLWWRKSTVSLVYRTLVLCLSVGIFEAGSTCAVFFPQESMLLCMDTIHIYTIVYVIVNGLQQRVSQDRRLVSVQFQTCVQIKTASQWLITCPDSLSLPMPQNLEPNSNFIFFHLSIHLNKIYVMSAHYVQDRVYAGTNDQT